MDLAVDAFEANDLKIRVVELSGTVTPDSAAAKPGWKLVTGHVRGPGGQWTVWLTGPAKTVDKSKDTWLKSAKLVDAPPPALDTEEIRNVRFVHGAPAHGFPAPWALTWYRLGADALGRPGLTRDQS